MDSNSSIHKEDLVIVPLSKLFTYCLLLVLKCSFIVSLLHYSFFVCLFVLRSVWSIFWEDGCSWLLGRSIHVLLCNGCWRACQQCSSYMASPISRLLLLHWNQKVLQCLLQHMKILIHYFFKVEILAATGLDCVKEWTATGLKCMKKNFNLSGINYDRIINYTSAQRRFPFFPLIMVTILNMFHLLPLL